MRAFRIAYDGTPYRGFQRQPDVPTVEDALFDALRRLEVLPAGADKPDGYAAAGRTDAGVSAVAQTVAFEAPDWLTPRAVNGELPADVRAWASADVSDSFHATHDAVRREYEYHLYAPPEASGAERGGRGPRDGTAGGRDSRGGEVGDHGSRNGGVAASDSKSVAIADPVDDDRVRTALEALSGTHDLHNLTPDDRNTERTLSLSARRDGAYLVLTAAAGGFSRELVRRLVSLVRAIGTGETSLGKIDRVLSPDPLPGHEGIAPAAPEPLVLVRVAYPDVAFRIDEEAATSARAVFERRRIERRTGARVARTVRDGLGE